MAEDGRVKWPQVSSAALELAAARARRYGSVPYSALGGAGRHPADPAVARSLAPCVDRWWEELGFPDPFVVVEEGAGDGTNARGVLETGLRCGPALRWILVEPSARLRGRQVGRLPLEPPELVLGPVVAGEDGEDPRPVADEGPLLASLADPPVVGGPSVVVAVDLLSTFPADRAEWRDGAWWEVVLAAAPGGGLAEARVPLAGRPPAGAVADGWQVPLARAARAWLQVTRGRAEPGSRVVVVDRVADTTAELAVGGELTATAETPRLSLEQLADPPPDRIHGGEALSPRRILEWDVGSTHG